MKKPDPALLCIEILKMIPKYHEAIPLMYAQLGEGLSAPVVLLFADHKIDVFCQSVN
jgi:hypothetical protein